MISDFFAATPAEVESLDIDKGPSGSVIDAKGIDPVKIVLLLGCFDGSSFDDNLSLIGEMLVREGGEEGPWVFQLPESLQKSLASADAAELEGAATAWASTEEWELDGGTPELTIPLVGEIAALARQAEAEQKSVYVWACL